MYCFNRIKISSLPNLSPFPIYGIHGHIGAITTAHQYKVVAPTGLLVHTFTCMATSLIMPILLSVTARLPYYVAGALATFFTLFFVIKVQGHRRDNDIILMQAPYDIKKKAKRLSFVEQEVVSISISRKKRNVFQFLSLPPTE